MLTTDFNSSSITADCPTVHTSTTTESQTTTAQSVVSASSSALIPIIASLACAIILLLLVLILGGTVVIIAKKLNRKRRIKGSDSRMKYISSEGEQLAMEDGSRSRINSGFDNRVVRFLCHYFSQ